MTTYSIGDLEAISGVKAHTIRTWEQRYHILTPERTSTNIRQYSETQLRILASLAFLIRQRVKISQLIGLSEEELREQVRRHLDVRSTHATQDTELLKMIAIQMDEEKFENFFSTLILQRGLTSCFGSFFPLCGHIFRCGTWNRTLRQGSLYHKPLAQKDSHSHRDPRPPGTINPDHLLFLPKDYHHELLCCFAGMNSGKKGIAWSIWRGSQHMRSHDCPKNRGR
jgi:DNA-binding transcriptional MerR regulator